MISDSHGDTLATWLEDAWLERYLDRELTDAETAWFEAYMLDKPRLIAAIDSDTSLRDGLHAWHAKQSAGALQSVLSADAEVPESNISKIDGTTRSAKSDR